jgi:hypothetical protein
MRAVDCLLLRVTCSAGLTPAFSSQVRCAALAAEKLENLRGISKDNCLLNRRGALLPRRHLASLVQGGDRLGVQIVSQRRWDFLLP